jgi:hypothetical protein
MLSTPANAAQKIKIPWRQPNLTGRRVNMLRTNLTVLFVLLVFVLTARAEVDYTEISFGTHASDAWFKCMADLNGDGRDDLSLERASDRMSGTSRKQETPGKNMSLMTRRRGRRALVGATTSTAMATPT